MWEVGRLLEAVDDAVATQLTTEGDAAYRVEAPDLKTNQTRNALCT